MSSVLITPAKLLDALITVDIKLYMAQHEDNADKIKLLNKKRCQIMNEIDENFHSWIQGNDLYPVFKESRDY